MNGVHHCLRLFDIFPVFLSEVPGLLYSVDLVLGLAKLIPC